MRGRCERPGQPYQPEEPSKGRPGKGRPRRPGKATDCRTLDKRCVLCDKRNPYWCAKCAKGYTKNRKDGRCQRAAKRG